MAKNDTKAAEQAAEQAVTEVDPWTVKKPIMIPKIPNSRDQADVVASVNGRHFSIQRGKTVEVPLPIYEVVKRSIDAAEEEESFYYNKAEVKEY